MIIAMLICLYTVWYHEPIFLGKFQVKNFGVAKNLDRKGSMLLMTVICVTYDSSPF